MSAPDGYVPLSQCGLWEWQRNYYQQAGIAAWPNGIPYYATSNPYIAHAYASVVLSFMLDSAASEPGRSGPFYVVELGSGSGTFAFHFLRSLERLLAVRGDAGLSFVYVMTDFQAGTIDFWRGHPGFAGFIERGALDFSFFEIESGTELHLLQSGRRLGPGGEGTERPLIVLANYVFDSVSQDVFRMQDGRLEELLVERSPVIPPAIEYNTSVPLRTLTDKLRFGEVELPYYGEPDLDAVVARLLEVPGDGFLAFPVGSLRCIRRLAACAGGRLLLLATDKAYSRYHDLYRRGEPDVAVHESFSMTVSFHAIGELCRHLGGDAWHQRTQQSITTSLFTLGCTLDSLPSVRTAVADHLEAFSPGNLYSLCRDPQGFAASHSLEDTLGYLAVTRWDPHVFDLIFEAILPKLRQSGVPALYDLAEALWKVGEGFYFLPSIPDTLTHIGIVFLELADYRAALEFFSRSAGYFGETEGTLYNLGLCHFSLGALETAAGLFQEVVARQPDHIMARGWLSQIAARREGEGASMNANVKGQEALG